MVTTPDGVHKVRLQPVGVLVFVHQNMLKPRTIAFPQLPLLLQQTQRQCQKIIIIHCLAFFFATLINLPHLGDPAFKLSEITKLILENRSTSRPVIRGQTKNLR